MIRDGVTLRSSKSIVENAILCFLVDGESRCCPRLRVLIFLNDWSSSHGCDVKWLMKINGYLSVDNQIQQVPRYLG